MKFDTILCIGSFAFLAWSVNNYFSVSSRPSSLPSRIMSHIYSAHHGIKLQDGPIIVANDGEIFIERQRWNKDKKILEPTGKYSHLNTRSIPIKQYKEKGIGAYTIPEKH